MNVSKPRPNDHPLLVLFIVGGVTCSEVHQIREALAAYHPNTQVRHLTLVKEFFVLLTSQSDRITNSLTDKTFSALFITQSGKLDHEPLLILV